MYGIDIELPRLQAEAVAVGSPFQPPCQQTEVTAHTGDVVVERLHRVVGRVVGPQRFDQPLGPDRPPGLESEQRQQGSPAAAGDVDGSALDHDGERTEEVDA